MVRRRFLLQVANQNLARNGQQVALAAIAAIPGETRQEGPFRRRQSPNHAAAEGRVRPAFPTPSVAASGSAGRGERRIPSPLPVVRPFLGKIQPHVDQSLFAAGNVGQKDSHLTVFDFAQASAPLPLHPYRMIALLRKRRRSDIARAQQEVDHLNQIDQQSKAAKDRDAALQAEARLRSLRIEEDRKRADIKRWEELDSERKKIEQANQEQEALETRQREGEVQRLASLRERVAALRSSVNTQSWAT